MGQKESKQSKDEKSTTEHKQSNRMNKTVTKQAEAIPKDNEAALKFVLTRIKQNKATANSLSAGLYNLQHRENFWPPLEQHLKIYKHYHKQTVVKNNAAPLLSSRAIFRHFSMKRETAFIEGLVQLMPKAEIAPLAKMCIQCSIETFITFHKASGENLAAWKDPSFLSGATPRVLCLLTRKRPSYQAHVPSLSRLAVDALLASQDFDTIYGLPDDVKAYLSRDSEVRWSFLDLIPNKKARSRMWSVVRMLEKSSIPFNQGKDIRVDFLHGYKRREDYGTGAIIVDGVVTFDMGKPQDICVRMDDQGYMMLYPVPQANPILAGEVRRLEGVDIFKTSHGTQMDSVDPTSIVRLMTGLGLEREEVWPFLVVVYNWCRYGPDASPERLLGGQLKGNSYCRAPKEFQCIEPEWWNMAKKLKSYY